MRKHSGSAPKEVATFKHLGIEWDVRVKSGCVQEIYLRTKPNGEMNMFALDVGEARSYGDGSEIEFVGRLKHSRKNPEDRLSKHFNTLVGTIPKS